MQTGPAFPITSAHEEKQHKGSPFANRPSAVNTAKIRFSDGLTFPKAV